MEENIAAHGIELTADQSALFDALAPAAGAQHVASTVASVDR